MLAAGKYYFFGYTTAAAFIIPGSGITTDAKFRVCCDSLSCVSYLLTPLALLLHSALVVHQLQYRVTTLGVLRGTTKFLTNSSNEVKHLF